ncbi:MAG: PD-(D/E)XK nuclease family protein [Acidimicrobiales bacterium]
MNVITTGFGPAATETLAGVLAAGRDGPLAPAVVVCPSGMAAIATRRALGRRPGGVAGITVTTTERLVDRLAGPVLTASGRRRYRAVEATGMIRAELLRRPGRFGRVAGHRATAERIGRVAHEVAGLPVGVLEAMADAGPPLTADALAIAASVLGTPAGDGHAPPVVGENTVLDTALDALAAVPDGAWGPIVVHLPEVARPAAGRVLAALAGRPDTTVVVGLTGVTGVDRAHADRLASWGIRIPAGDRPHWRPVALIEVADPGDEVTAAIAELSAHAAAGVPRHRLAILHPDRDGMAARITDRLDEAGVAWSGPGHRPLAGSMTGRFLRRLLELSRTGPDRSAVIDLLAAGPVVHDGNLAPAYRWDRLSRRAGVVGDDQWEPRLAALARQADPAERAEIEALSAFITWLRGRLRPPGPGSPWSEWGRWAGDLLADVLAPVEPPGTAGSDPDAIGRTVWPDDEIEARRLVLGVLADLAPLDRLLPAPGPAMVADVITGELERITMPGHPLGSGILVAPVGDAVGLDHDHVVVVGLAEGIFPRPRRGDPLLPGAVRERADGLLPAEPVTEAIDLRVVAAALAGSVSRPLVTLARGDLRSNRRRSPVRAVQALVEPSEVTSVDSHQRLLEGHGRPVAVADLELRHLLRHVGRGQPLASHPLASTDPVLVAGVARAEHRQTGAGFNPHVGRVPGGVDLTDRLLSATALEDYVTCPRRYLFGRVLRLREDERPERIHQITARDRGSLLHAVLEQFVAEQIEADTVPAPDEPWSDDQRQRLRGVLDEQLERFRTAGLTGGRVSTAVLERRLGVELDRFLRRDEEFRRSRRATPVAAELGFGFDDDPGVIELPDGRAVRMRGRVDRVDTTEDGGVLVVDYKGGSGSEFAKLDVDPLQGGRRLQLPLYARVVADRLDRVGPRTAVYWLTRTDTIKPVTLDGLDPALDTVVGSILDGITTGLFPAVPGDAVGWPRLSYAHCRWCDFERVCPTDRGAEWDRVAPGAELDPIRALLDGAGDAAAGRSGPTGGDDR